MVSGNVYTSLSVSHPPPLFLCIDSKWCGMLTEQEKIMSQGSSSSLVFRFTPLCLFSLMRYMAILLC
uniref:Uncharacterized protein n=1 Tax=Anguilla anguilla TaxID=7936 RepID=A0A0E9PTR7_ANGAN